MNEDGLVLERKLCPQNDASHQNSRVLLKTLQPVRIASVDSTRGQRKECCCEDLLLFFFFSFSLWTAAPNRGGKLRERRWTKIYFVVHPLCGLWKIARYISNGIILETNARVALIKSNFYLLEKLLFKLQIIKWFFFNIVILSANVFLKKNANFYLIIKNEKIYLYKCCVFSAYMCVTVCLKVVFSILSYS